MKRTLMQVYVKNSREAVLTYQKAFDAKLGYNVKNDDGSYYHSELDVYGQILAVAQMPDNKQTLITGNVMQFCLHFKDTEKSCIDKAYETLKLDATILVPLGPCDFSDYMTDFIDKYGVRWCLFL
ncbi:MAG: VOC family protein [Coprobacillaceae bacterium]